LKRKLIKIVPLMVIGLWIYVSLYYIQWGKINWIETVPYGAENFINLMQGLIFGLPFCSLGIYYILYRLGVYNRVARAMTLKVLHIGSTAGIGSNLAYFMKCYYDINSWVMIRRRYDQYNLSNEFVKSLECSFKEYLIRVWIKGLTFDIIHIHGADKTLRILKRTFPYKNKKIIIHYHGSHIRDRWEEKRFRWKYADKIIVSTPDLLIGAPEGTEYLPNVINEKICDLHKREEKERDLGFHVYHEANDEATEYFHVHGVRGIFHYPEIDSLDHHDFLKKLSGYEYYIDVKRKKGKILEAMSVTGLEALYMGVKVIKWDGRLISDFPVQHQSINVCSKLKEIYEDLMK